MFINPETMDCTLRDGGYINNWQFSGKTAYQIIETLDKSGVEKTECGYLTDKISNAESTLFYSTEQFDLFFDGYGKELKTELYLMVNHNEFGFEKLGKSRFLTGIRYAFHRQDYQNIRNNLSLLKEKGYRVCLQPMITTAYSEKETSELVNLCNEFNAEALYIVDSFGNITVKQLKDFYRLMDKALKPEIKIGFHAHNNMLLAFANTVSFIGLPENNPRQLIVDSTIGGLGRGAGNLSTEIISLYLNKKAGKNYCFTEIVEYLEKEPEIFRHKNLKENFLYFYAGLLSLHPNVITKYLHQNMTLKEITGLLGSQS